MNVSGSVRFNGFTWQYVVDLPDQLGRRQKMIRGFSTEKHAKAALEVLLKEVSKQCDGNIGR